MNKDTLIAEAKERQDIAVQNIRYITVAYMENPNVSAEQVVREVEQQLDRIRRAILDISIINNVKED